MDIAKSSSASAGGDGTSEGEDKNNYTVGWICALPLEMAAAKLMLDEVHQFEVEQDEGDHNTYILGVMRGHRVVVACLPKGVYGTTTAATVAKDMLRTFKSIRFGLMVGVGGAAPSLAHDIRLGDVVVSIPTDVNGGVIQYDRGKTGNYGEFKCTGSLNAPPTVLLTAVGSVETNHSLGGSDIPQFLADAAEKIPMPMTRQKYVYQGEANDCLFHSEYEHVNPDAGCDECDAAQTVQREERDDKGPVVHYGNIASGNQVIKHAETRDRLSKKLGVLCFEMEAAGLMQEFPCLVIRGICDYSDSHKNKRWQEYAAATAAAYAKEILSAVAPARVKKERLIQLDRQLQTLTTHTKAILQHTQKLKIRHENDENRKCLNDLCNTDPKKDRLRIIAGKNGRQSLYEESYEWIMDLPEFRNWQTHPASRLLWIKGGPGKGKTMLLCGIIEKLENDEVERLSYFFCQATVPALNNATSVVRGLIYQMVKSHPQLLRMVLGVYEDGGKTRFEDHNAWETMSELFISMISDRCMDGVQLIVDALDECVTDRLKLLVFIRRILDLPHVKIIVSSREWPEIHEMLGNNNDNSCTIALELHDNVISQAVQSYIGRKVAELSRLKALNSNTSTKIEAYLRKQSQNTFLWVALVCQELFDYGQNYNIMKVVNTFPPGLDALYTRMITSIPFCDSDLFQDILAVVSVLKRPVTAEELLPLIRSPIDGGMKSLEQAITSWGSFFNIQDGKIYFAHQSAVEYLRSEASGLPDITDRHRGVFLVSLDALHGSKHIKRDIYDLRQPAISHMEIRRSSPDPLSALRYCCVYWIDHLFAWAGEGMNTGKTPLLQEPDVLDRIENFLRDKFLYWVEALALIHHMPQAVQAIQKLQMLTDRGASQVKQGLSEFIHDANRFLLFHRATIETFPLQVYSSALVFSPQQSVVKNHFQHEAPKWVNVMLRVDTTWDACIHTLEGHKSSVQTVSYSPDGQWLVSGDEKGNLKLWQADSGNCVQTVCGSNPPSAGDCFSVCFSPNSQSFISQCRNGVIKVWDVATGKCVRELKVHPHYPANQLYAVTMAISGDGCTIACASRDNDIVVWSVGTNVVSSTLKGHTGLILSAALTSDGQRLVSGSVDGVVMMWNTLTRTCHQITAHNAVSHSIIWSTDEEWIALSSGYSIQVLELESSKSIWEFDRPAGPESFGHMAFSASKELLAASLGKCICVWNMTTGALIRRIGKHSRQINSISFSPDARRIVSASLDNTIKMWDIPKGDENTPDSSSVWDTDCGLYHSNQHQFATYSESTQKIRIWDRITECGEPVAQHIIPKVRAIAFSQDNEQLALGDSESQITIWNTKSGTCYQTLDYYASLTNQGVGNNALDASSAPPATDRTKKTPRRRRQEGEIASRQKPGPEITSLAFQGNVHIASNAHGELRIWNISEQTTTPPLEERTTSMLFSPDCQWLIYIYKRIFDSHKPTQGKRLKNNPRARDMIAFRNMAANSCISTSVVPETTISMSFSANSQHLALSMHQSILLWEVSSGSCIWKFEKENVGPTRVLFDTKHEGRLHTQYGFIECAGQTRGYRVLKGLKADCLNPNHSKADVEHASLFVASSEEAWLGYGFSEDLQWIALDRKRLLRIPLEYRLGNTFHLQQTTPVINGRSIMWITEAGKPVRMNFTEQE